MQSYGSFLSPLIPPRRTTKRDSNQIYTSIKQFNKLVEISTRENSKVFRAECAITGMEVALKRFEKRALSAKEAVHLAREVHLMGILRSDPGVIHILGFFEDEDYAYIVMEFCNGRDLYHSVVAEQRLDEHFAAAVVIAPLLATLHRLHTSHRIIHRDIKPENILISSDREIRLADLGTAIQYDIEVPFLAVGTLDFCSPEVLGSVAPKGAVESPCTTLEMINEAGLKSYDFKADIWSIGAVAYELVIGEPPFYHEDPQQTKNLILGSAYLYFPPKYKDTPFSRFVKVAMTKNPHERPTALELLRHEWLTLHLGTNCIVESKDLSPHHKHSISIHVDATGVNTCILDTDMASNNSLDGHAEVVKAGPAERPLQSSSSTSSADDILMASVSNYSDSSQCDRFRIKYSILPHGSWLRKFSIRRPHQESMHHNNTDANSGEQL